MENFFFSTDVRVRFAETDAQGVAHNAAYLVWYEVARIDYLSRFRGGYKGLQEEGYEALTTETHVRYLAPVYFDDMLRVHARCSEIRGARFRYDYAIERASDGVVVADGWTQHAVVDRGTFRPTRFPAWLAEEISRSEQSRSEV
jgi:acyl-CoA thioester hydrolase